MRDKYLFIYEYYRNGGVKTWLIDKISKQITVLSIGAFFLFFLSLYDFSTGIVKYNDSIIGIFIFMFFLLEVVVVGYKEAIKYPHYIDAKSICDGIGITEDKLSYIRWRDVAYKLVEHGIIDNEVMIQCTVTCNDNFIIGMVDKGIIVGNMFLSELYINILKRCIFDYSNKEGKSKNFTYICLTYAIISLVLIPYLIMHYVTYSLIKYAIVIYNNPSNLIEMKWSVLGQYTFRHYNELPHEFEGRMRNASQVMLRYNSLFPSPIISKISERLAFIVSEVVISLLLILYFTPHSTTQMFIKGLTTLLITWGVLDKLVEKKANKPNPIDVKNELNDILMYHDHEFDVSLEDKNRLSKFFQYHMSYALTEFLAIFMTPLLLFYTTIYSDVRIANYIDSNLKINDTIGVIYNGTEFNREDMEDITASKLLQSYHQYEREYSDSQSIKYSKMLNSRFLDEA